METTELLNELTAIVAHVLDSKEVHLSEETTAHDVDGWNSLTNMQIVSDIEKHFGIKFKLREIIKMKNVGDLCRIVQSKL
jgi:acyl carrier protein